MTIDKRTLLKAVRHLQSQVIDDLAKSIRWSRKNPGHAGTSHGKYAIHTHLGDDGEHKHTVTYTNKTTGQTETGTYDDHRSALGAVTEHHLKNRPPPQPKKPRAKKPRTQPENKTLKHGEGGCPPCP